MKQLRFILLLALIPGCLLGQVDQIKSASSSRSGSGKSEGGKNSGAVLFDVFFNVVFGEVVNAQQRKLQRRHEVPGIVSLDLQLQGAAQPSSYYILTPRIRANWGLFSTDYRVNYLLEEGIDEVKHIRTNDWQILQLNIVTAKDASFSVGGGFMQEAFGGGNVYGEYTMRLAIHPQQSKLGGTVEYRNADVRGELNGFVFYKMFDKGFLHGSITAGAIYQRYYQQVTVWGLQTGLIFRIY